MKTATLRPFKAITIQVYYYDGEYEVASKPTLDASGVAFRGHWKTEGKRKSIAGARAVYTRAVARFTDAGVERISLMEFDHNPESI